MIKSILIVWVTAAIVFATENFMAWFILWDSHWLQRLPMWEVSGRVGFLFFFIVIPFVIGVFVAAAVQINKDQTK